MKEAPGELARLPRWSADIRSSISPYGREADNRELVKAHLMCGTKTQIVTAVDISGWAANDTTYFVPLVQATAEHFGIREVSADKAYLSRKNLSAVESVGGMPFVPFKSITVDPTEAGAWARMYHLFMYRREEYMEHYHKRSNIETAFSRIKGKFGSALRSKSDTGQINEALCKVLAHNICVLFQAMYALARCLGIVTPGGLAEKLLTGLGEPAKAETLPPLPEGPPDVERIAAIASKYDTEMVLPPGQ